MSGHLRVLGVIPVSDAYKGSAPGMTGKPSSNTTFTVAVPGTYRLTFKQQDMLTLLVA